jgi:hypothetical protein
MEWLALIIISIAGTALFLWFSLYFVKLFFWLFVKLFEVSVPLVESMYRGILHPILSAAEVILALTQPAEFKRVHQLESWALELGLAFERATDHGLGSRFPDLKCLAQGSRQYATTLIEGVWDGWAFLGFDYHYQTATSTPEGRRHLQMHHFSAVILTSDVPLQPLFICPKEFAEHSLPLDGYEEVQFEHAGFSSWFSVKAMDKDWARKAFDEQTLELLLRSPRYLIEFGRAHIMAYRPTLFSEMNFEDAADLVRGILERLPGLSDKI